MTYLGNRPHIVLLAALTLSCASVSGQGFNIDIDGTPSTLPGVNYPAFESLQLGRWFPYSPFDQGSNAETMTDIYGMPTNVSISSANPIASPAWSLNLCPNAPIAAADAAMMCDVVSGANVRRFTVNGLLPGRYAFYVYGWQVLYPQTMTVSIPGVNPGTPKTTVGTRVYPASMLNLVTHTIHVLDVEAGDTVSIVIAGPGGAVGGGPVGGPGGLNPAPAICAGIQIVPQPIGVSTDPMIQAVSSAGTRGTVTAYGGSSLMSDAWFQVEGLPVGRAATLWAGDLGVPNPVPAPCPLEGFLEIAGNRAPLLADFANAAGALRFELDLGVLAASGLNVPGDVWFQVLYDDPGVVQQSICSGGQPAFVTTKMTNGIRIGVTP